PATCGVSVLSPSNISERSPRAPRGEEDAKNLKFVGALGVFLASWRSFFSRSAVIGGAVTGSAPLRGGAGLAWRPAWKGRRTRRPPHARSARGGLPGEPVPREALVVAARDRLARLADERAVQREVVRREEAQDEDLAREVEVPEVRAR